MHLGEVIKRYREDNDISMEEFAKRISRTKSYISMLEKNVNNRTKKPITPSIETFIAIAEAMNLSTQELVSILDPSQKEKYENAFSENGLPKTKKNLVDLSKFLNETEILFEGENYKLNADDKAKLKSALQFVFWTAKERNKRSKKDTKKE